MTDVVERILDVRRAKLLLQWSSTKGQSLAEGGVAEHLIVKVKVGSKLSLFGETANVPWFRPLTSRTLE